MTPAAPYRRQVEEPLKGGTEKGEGYEQFPERHGDWARDMAPGLRRRQGGLTQAELGAAAGGMAYPAVGHAVRRIERRRQPDRRFPQLMERLERQLVEIAT